MKIKSANAIVIKKYWSYLPKLSLQLLHMQTNYSGRKKCRYPFCFRISPVFGNLYNFEFNCRVLHYFVEHRIMTEDLFSVITFKDNTLSCCAFNALSDVESVSCVLHLFVVFGFSTLYFTCGLVTAIGYIRDVRLYVIYAYAHTVVHH